MTDAFLLNLDNLLSEFYSASSDNARKAQIERDLHNLKSADNCLEYCVQLLQQSQSQYSQWWALSTLEEHVARKWSSLSDKFRVDLREFLYHGSVRENQIQFITVKYIKVFINIGIRQWPCDDTFFKQIMQLVSNSSAHQETGISMLEVLSEEISRARVDIHWDVLQGSKVEMSSQIPTILSTLTSILEKGAPDTTLLSTTLQCLAHLLSWVSLTDILTPALISSIFHCARQGGVVAGVHAMSCINEIVRRNLVPAQVEDFVLQLFQQTLLLLTSVTGADIDTVDTGYLKKLIEFLSLFTSGHLRRVESNASFPVLEFLSLLFTFTERQRDADLFSGTVDVCSSWVDFLLSVQGSLSPDGAVPRYGDALTTLAQLLVTKVCYHSNNAMLEDVDDTLTESETMEICHTEWDLFLGKITQLMSKIMDLHPICVSQILISLMDSHCNKFYQLESLVKIGSSGLRVESIDEEEFCKSLRDIATVIHLSQLSLPALVGDNFAAKQGVAQGILHHVMKCISLSARITEQCRDTKCDVRRGHAQILEGSVCVLSAFSQWFLLVGQNSAEQFPNMIASVLDAVLPSFNYQVEARLQQSVVDLLYKIVIVCRPPSLLSVSSLQTLYRHTVAGKYHSYSLAAKTTLNKALTLTMVLPWLQTTTSDQQWPTREQHFQHFIQELFNPLILITAGDIQDSSSLSSHAPALSHYLTTLSDVVSCVAHRESKSKQIVCTAVLPLVRHLITLLPLFEKSSQIFEHVLAFTTVLCDALRVQLGATFLKDLVGLCLQNFAKSRGSGGDVARTTVEKFIELLTTVIREPSAVFKSFTPDIIQITLHDIRECVDKMESLRPVYCLLIHSILDFNWNHFFPRGQKEDVCINQEQLLALFQPFGESLLKPDFNLIKHNITALMDLNDKHELFTKEVFVTHLKPTFMKVLLSLTFCGNVQIIEEEIDEVLFHLANSNSRELYLSILTEYLLSAVHASEMGHL